MSSCPEAATNSCDGSSTCLRHRRGHSRAPVAFARHRGRARPTPWSDDSHRCTASRSLSCSSRYPSVTERAGFNLSPRKSWELFLCYSCCSRRMEVMPTRWEPRCARTSQVPSKTGKSTNYLIGNESLFYHRNIPIYIKHTADWHDQYSQAPSPPRPTELASVQTPSAGQSQDLRSNQACSQLHHESKKPFLFVCKQILIQNARRWESSRKENCACPSAHVLRNLHKVLVLTSVRE